VVKHHVSTLALLRVSVSSGTLVNPFLIFKLEEENPALLLHLPKVFVEIAFCWSAACLGCVLVVKLLQVSSPKTAVGCASEKRSDVTALSGKFGFCA
jgi:hypothetical protein